jgi:hypothetical protein
MEDAVDEWVAAIVCQGANLAKFGRARNEDVQNLEAWQEGYAPFELLSMNDSMSRTLNGFLWLLPSLK